MSLIAENWALIFYAEGDDAVEYIDMIDEEDEASAIDQIVGGKLDEIEDDDISEPEEDDEMYEHEDGYILFFSRSLERVWVYEIIDTEDGF